MTKWPALLAGVVITSSPAFAETIEITFGNFTGEWLNAVTSDGGDSTSTSGTETDPVLSWGRPATSEGQTSYTFESEAAFTTLFDSSAETSDIFNLGTFTHSNNPIYSPTLVSVDLKLTTTVQVGDLEAAPVEFLFSFSHDETPNSASPCKYDDSTQPGVNDNGCADSITLTSSLFTQTFTIGNTDYTIAIEGFKVGETTVDSFLTKEKADNEAIIIAKVTSYEAIVTGGGESGTPTDVPEPEHTAIAGILFSLYGGRRWSARKRRMPR